MTITAEAPTTTAAAQTGPRRSAVLPPVHPRAWAGPLGEAACRIAPTTEADPVAVLAQLLALFGAMCGDAPHVRLGGVDHPARIWPLVVGKTGSGRKGTSLAEARSLARTWGPYADRYLAARIAYGLSSGEGLLASLGAGSNDHDGPDREAVAPDGRLMVVETEFARVLTAAKRDGSTLGPILRQMWDAGDAQIMTRAAPLKVSGAHLGLVAHITPRELRAKLQESDVAGGTLNRLLIIASERPHLLPHEPRHPAVEDLAQDLTVALEQARSWGREIRRDREAEALWPDVYAALAAEEPDGMLGSVLARGPAYTMRLALAFALSEGSSTISKHHLLSGLALWHYSTASARLLFGDARTSTDEHRLVAALADAGDGLTRTEIYQLFGGNRRAEQLQALVEHLERAGRVAVTVAESTGGRPAHRYRATGRSADPILDILSQG